MRRAARALLLLAATDFLWVRGFLEDLVGGCAAALVSAGLLAFYCWILVRPCAAESGQDKREFRLSCGSELLRLFLFAASCNTLWILYIVSTLLQEGPPQDAWEQFGFALCIVVILLTVVMEAALFWAGLLRLYAASPRLRGRHLALAALWGWVPLLNIWYLTKLIHAASAGAGPAGKETKEKGAE